MTPEEKEQVMEVNKVWKDIDNAWRPEVPSDPPLLVKRLTQTATLPTKGSSDAAGWDLYADIPDEPFIKNKNQFIYNDTVTVVSTGIAVAIPKGYYGRVAPRSGLATNAGIVVLGGAVDSDYRGEVKVLLSSHCAASGVVAHGMRIAQLIIEKISTGPIIEVGDLDETSRGDKGFGSTGK